MNNLYPGGMPKIPYTRPRSIADLDDYIRSNLSVRQKQKQQSDAIIEAEQNAELQRQMQQDALDQASQQNMLGTATSLGTTAAMLAGKEGIAKGAGYLAEGAYNLLPETTQTAIANYFVPNVATSASGVAPELASTVSPVVESLGTTAMGDAGSLAGVTADSLAGTSVAGSVAPEVATGVPSSLAPLAGTATETGAAPVAATLAEEGGALASETAVSGGLGAGTTGEMASAVGSYATPVLSALSYAAPYYALAKAGGMAINAITDNNPWMKETPFGRLGGSLEEPLAVEDYWSGELSRHGVGNEQMWEGFNNANPLEVGGWIKNTRAKATSAITGGMSGLSDFAVGLGNEFGIDPDKMKGGLSIATGGLSKIGEIGKSSEDTKDALISIASGGVSDLIDEVSDWF